MGARMSQRCANFQGTHGLGPGDRLLVSSSNSRPISMRRISRVPATDLVQLRVTPQAAGRIIVDVAIAADAWIASPAIHVAFSPANRTAPARPCAVRAPHPASWRIHARPTA